MLIFVLKGNNTMKKLLFLYFCGIIFFCGNYLSCDEPADRRIEFINEGFGFQYSDDEIEDIDLFILRHGNPLNIYEENEENIGNDIFSYNITLEYDTIFVKFYKWRVYGTNDYNTLLIYITSKDNSLYLHGIKHGLTFNDLEKIIGEIEFRNDDASVVLRNKYDNEVRIWFYEEKIERIEWRYSIQ
jgi:hypothetical protein